MVLLGWYASLGRLVVKSESPDRRSVIVVKEYYSGLIPKLLEDNPGYRCEFYRNDPTGPVLLSKQIVYGESLDDQMIAAKVVWSDGSAKVSLGGVGDIDCVNGVWIESWNSPKH